MRIAIVHNQYGKFSGEEAVVRDQAALLRSRGHEVEFFLRSSTELMQMRFSAEFIILSRFAPSVHS